jgi:curved DNA-binding protein CbpA
MNSAFAILGLNENCDSDAEIKKAYRDLALENHPDRVADDKKDEASAKMSKINDAYQLIKMQEARDVYRAGYKMR